MASAAEPSSAAEHDHDYDHDPDRYGEDADTCRICRGEGTPDETLFYPCKCSGSIKYVHQACLMEWLSHSQKKHCELCKTSFRFTKLYHPGMPSHIPFSVFIRRATLHVLKMLVTWCRAVLVASVWLVILPYCMRLVWRSLFWVGDGNWSPQFLRPKPTPSFADPLNLKMVQSEGESAKAADPSVIHLRPTLLRPYSQTLNLTAGESTVWVLIKQTLLALFPLYEISTPAEANMPPSNSTTDAGGMGTPSLLSEISFFHWFPSQAANRFVIDVLEGQIITLLVVVAFILIFLIREWVVQQQPVINMVALDEDARQGRAPFDADETDSDDSSDDEDEGRTEDGEDDEDDGHVRVYGAPGPHDENGEEEPAHILRRRKSAILHVLIDTEDDISEHLQRAVQDDSVSFEHMTDLIERELLQEDPVQPRERYKRPSEDTHTTAVGHERDCSGKRRKILDNESEPSASDSSAFPRRSSSLPPSPGRASDPLNSHQRPNMPSRDRSSIATEIQRDMEEGDTWSFANAPQPAPEVESESRHGDENTPESWEDEPEDRPSSMVASMGSCSHDVELDSEHSSESWQQVPSIPVDDTSSSTDEVVQSKDKGKRRASTGSEPALGLEPEPMPDLGLESRPEPESELTSDADQDQMPNDPEEEPHQRLDAEPEPIPAPPRPAARPIRPVGDRFLDWLFGDVAPVVRAVEEDANDEHIVEDLANEAPFVPIAANEQAANLRQQDPEVAAAAAQAGIDLNDQDAIDDAEDLEGIMELIGMQGPIIGLFQNALFSAVLISGTITLAVWLPYLWGKVVLLLMGSPVSIFIKLPLRLVAALADLVVDTAVFIVAGAVLCWSHLFRIFANTIHLGKAELRDGRIDLIAGPARSLAAGAMVRINRLVFESSWTPHPDAFRFSVNSHVALRTIQNSTNYAFNQTGNAIVSLYENVVAESMPETVSRVLRQLPSKLQAALSNTVALASWLWKSKSYKITLNWDFGRNFTSTYTDVEPWTATDRLIATLTGYASLAVVGALYLRRRPPISSSQQIRKIEAIAAEVLQQAGGVLKVILIIAIEMLVFPLYCGLLLDTALLPVFRDATLYSRWQYACENPWKSGFVHWFIGTCYMFHFALFVSMCRKIMRKGVLYFIRDPDDPTFHPVRDVLERSVTTQLKKIAFSGLVYGALVIFCLGSVVWGLSWVTNGILPIHWTSVASALEFPLDLLFYNFLTPFIIRIYKPSDGLHAVYQWWMKASARFLRLTNFLFDEKREDEEGHHVRPTWSSWVFREKGDLERRHLDEDLRVLEEKNGQAYFVFDGKYVRAPASDQTRIPKGHPVFVEVDHLNNRKDGVTLETNPDDVHNSDHLVAMVYIPPWFRARITLFVLAIWVFAAITGIGVTVLPLLFGRHLFSMFLPPTVEINDIHALALGLYSLGAFAYSVFYLYKFASSLNRSVPAPFSAILSLANTAFNIGLRVVRLGYVWTSLVFVVPFMFATILELYFLIPLHAYLGPTEPHVVHLIQDWTVGFFYARIASQIILFDRNSRAARAFNAAMANGFFNPNARLVTRYFLLPITAIFALAVMGPASLAWTLNQSIPDEETRSNVWRFSFPFVGASLVAIWIGREGAIQLYRWRSVVRDEVYLIGERLHNFGDRKVAPPPASGGGTVAAESKLDGNRHRQARH